VLSQVQHHLPKQLTAGKKQVSPSTTPNTIKGKTLHTLGKAIQQLAQTAQHHELLT